MKKIKIPFSERFYRLLTELPPDDEDEKTAAARLVIFINVHRFLYYVLCYNIISDRLFDAAYHKLLNNKYFIAGTINDVGSSNEEDYSIDIKEMALSFIEQNLYATYLSDKDGWRYILNKDNQIIGQKEGVYEKDQQRRSHNSYNH